MDAHVYAKCNNFTEASSSLIKFLSAANLYTTISFEFFKEIVESAFVIAWFSFQIYNSKDGTVCISERSVHIIEPVHLTGKTLHEASLVDLTVSVGTLAAVDKALAWVDCLISNLFLYEDYTNNKYHGIYEFALVVVQTVLNGELSTAHLTKLLPRLKSICKSIVGGKLDFQYKSKIYNGFKMLYQCNDMSNKNFKLKDAINEICNHA